MFRIYTAHMRFYIHFVRGRHRLTSTRAQIAPIAYVTCSLLLDCHGQFILIVAVLKNARGETWHFIQAGGMKRLGPAIPKCYGLMVRGDIPSCRG